MNKKLGKIGNIFAVSAMLFLSANCSFSADINLSEINISQGQNGYNITLKSDKDINFKKTLKNEKQLLINLKNTSTTDDFTTSYNGVSDVQNVTVTPEKDNLKIEIQGENVKNSSISVEPLQGTILPAKVMEYEIDTAKNSQKPQSAGGFNYISTLGLGLMILTAGKLFAKKDKNSTEIPNTEKNVAGRLNTEMRDTMLLRNKITRNTTAPSINYETKKRHLHELTAVKVRAERARAEIAPKAKAQATSPIQRNVNIDSIKFLESMTKIYEKTGRNDLAANIKRNIDKVNI